MVSAHEKLKVDHGSLEREYDDFKKECDELVEASLMLEASSNQIADDYKALNMKDAFLKMQYEALEVKNDSLQRHNETLEFDNASLKRHTKALEVTNEASREKLAECKDELAQVTGAHRNDVDMNDSVCSDDRTEDTITVSEYERQAHAASMSHGTSDT
ncbi:hypothetical protein CYMTET_38658 [Cymbomonas tetramitiformis]|uniref:Uncharacterized protein n=1 Tax=Cymbomonas tetramitiformis TaxID=36881 RepID=A0AAE0CD14_9CHLO|nr:hypothetical protein CYMTET_38658 [Cymbomonas tetramitiformis]